MTSYYLAPAGPLQADDVRIGAPTLVEASIVFSGRRKAPDKGEVDALIRELGVTVVPFGEAEWHLAIDAFRRFGRGRHAAALNFGDCLAYATALSAVEGLLTAAPAAPLLAEPAAGPVFLVH